MISLRCPECFLMLDPESLQCSKGHSVKKKDGVIELLSETFRNKLQPFLSDYHRFQKSANKWDEDEQQDSPFFFEGPRKKEWNFRRKSLEVVDEYLKSRKGLRILEIGPWNGWLSRQLISKGNSVLAIDYFLEEPYGLKSVFKNNPEVNCIQMNLQDLSPLPDTFDIIILNHCLQFMPDPIGYTKVLREKIQSGGEIFILGSPIYFHPQKKIAAIREQEIKYKRDFGAELFFQAGKGFLDKKDFKAFQDLGFTFNHYPDSVLKNYFSRFSGLGPIYVSGKFVKTIEAGTNSVRS